MQNVVHIVLRYVCKHVCVAQPRPTLCASLSVHACHAQHLTSKLCLPPWLPAVPFAAQQQCLHVWKCADTFAVQGCVHQHRPVIPLPWTSIATHASSLPTSTVTPLSPAALPFSSQPATSLPPIACSPFSTSAVPTLPPSAPAPESTSPAASLPSIPPPSLPPPPPSQDNALLLVKVGLSSPASLVSWSGVSPCSGWAGVTCDGSSVARSLDLSFSYSLTGTLPDDMRLVTYLNYLDLSGESFTGTLPSSWSSLQPLTFLKLSNNQLIGGLPQAWSALSNLQQLDLSNNLLTSTIPAAWPLGMTALTRLILSTNSMCGSIPGPSWNSTAGLVVYTSPLGTPCPAPPPPPPSPPTPPPPPPTIGHALYSLQGVVTSASWTASGLNWTSSSDPCVNAWTRVTCSGGVPVSVDLSYKSLVGSLPSLWNFVPSLQSISMASNTFSSSLPAPWYV